MPGSTPLPLDLRLYRPAAVLAIDLVKHSTRDHQTVNVIQGVLSGALESVVASLQLKDVHVNHTGDGYVCTLYGDDAARILDFLNALYPGLISRLADFEQEIRVGLAFGILHFRTSPLTQTPTHFDLPGIEATRLEQAAKPGQILCTQTVQLIFVRHYPTMFGSQLLHIQTKDREIEAYELIPFQEWSLPIKQFLVDVIYRRQGENVPKAPGALLVVEDDSLTRHWLASVFRREFPDRQVFEAESAEVALDLLDKNAFAVVLTDIVMPGLSGVELTKMIREKYPKQIVMAISGYASSQVVCAFIQVGGDNFVQKPFAEEELVRAVNTALTHPEGRTIMQQLGNMCDDAAALFHVLHQLSRKMDNILDSVGRGRDVARDLLRHKAKHLINDSMARLGPGSNPITQLQSLMTQLSCVERLARIVGQLGVQRLSAFLATLIGDLRKVHPQVEFTLSDNANDELSEVDFGGVVILAIAELIDNAVAAVGDRGTVDVEIDTLRAAGMLQISVRDTGPGVSRTLEDSVFDETVSTKGAGRGLGLHLVREALLSLHGSITYARAPKSTFCARIPLMSSMG